MAPVVNRHRAYHVQKADLADRAGAEMDTESGGPRSGLIRYLGHATVLIELDGTSIMTDPVLRGRFSVLMRHRSLERVARSAPVDAVLISHLHHDHLDVPSLRQLGRTTRIFVPRGGGNLLKRRGFSEMREMQPGNDVAVGSVQVRATSALHTGYRVPFGPSGDCLGFIVEGSTRVYFAGDTDVFPDMAALGPIDVALLPVAGWGPVLGPGHMGPLEAAHALRLIRPKVAIPIHWGTFAPIGIHLRHWPYLVNPPLDFVNHARDLAPDVEVRVLQPGQSFDLAALPRHAPSTETSDAVGVGAGHPTDDTAPPPSTSAPSTGSSTPES
jgi:L-ascorbate metabolism protein UlaG (beta-lactamase superfamily)